MRRLDDRLTVSPQVRETDLPALSEAGVRVIVNNRPDGEEPGQPDGETIRRAAEALGLDYVAAPISGRPTQAAADALAGALASTDGAVHAYCKSGTRSSWAWAMMAAGQGVPAEEIVARGAEAGYDLRPLFV